MKQKVVETDRFLGTHTNIKVISLINKSYTHVDV